ncbi:MAG: hypothetical protein SWJ54_13765 [Cyanobacteriota bacterium]|nr:hypothetical protein [Cyanobacteriota bacterium]
MSILTINNLDYLAIADEDTTGGRGFKVPVFKVDTKVDSDAKTVVKSNVKISKAPKIGLEYDLGVASGLGVAFGFSINGKSLADVELNVGFSR